MGRPAGGGRFVGETWREIDDVAAFQLSALAARLLAVGPAVDENSPLETILRRSRPDLDDMIDEILEVL